MTIDKIKEILEKGLYQNGEQPDIVLEQGVTVDDIEIENVDLSKFNPGTVSRILGQCTMYGKDTEGEPISVTGKFAIEFDNENQPSICYDDFI